jgi:hypothetical protein
MVSFERHLQMMTGNFGHFPKYHMKILLGDFNTKLGGEDIGNESHIRIVTLIVLE